MIQRREDRLKRVAAMPAATQVTRAPASRETQGSRAGAHPRSECAGGPCCNLSQALPEGCSRRYELRGTPSLTRAGRVVFRGSRKQPTGAKMHTEVHSSTTEHPRDTGRAVRATAAAVSIIIPSHMG